MPFFTISMYKKCKLLTIYYAYINGSCLKSLADINQRSRTKAILSINGGVRNEELEECGGDDCETFVKWF